MIILVNGSTYSNINDAKAYIAEFAGDDQPKRRRHKPIVIAVINSRDVMTFMDFDGETDPVMHESGNPDYRHLTTMEHLWGYWIELIS